MVKRTKKHRKHLRKTKKKGGGILYAPVAVRNVQYIKTLENRLVNKCNDYEWVQARRKKNWLLTHPKSYYTENNYTGDDKKEEQKEEQKKNSGWSLW